VRLIVLLLIVALSGPSTGSLLCDWACAAKHQRTKASGSCHEHRSPASSSTVAAGHRCHDLASGPASILTDTRQAEFSAPAIVEAPLVTSAESVDHVTHRTRDVAHAPPPSLITSLRI
jgi:hypothetical protein